MRTSKGLANYLTTSAAVTLIAACASTQPRNVQGHGPGNAQFIERTCHDVLGLWPGEVHFDACRSGLAESAKNLPAATHPPQVVAEPAAGYRSYFDMSPALRHERVRMACDRLGMDPASAIEGRCVARLESRFFNSDHPLD